MSEIFFGKVRKYKIAWNLRWHYSLVALVYFVFVVVTQFVLVVSSDGVIAHICFLDILVHDMVTLPAHYTYTVRICEKDGSSIFTCHPMLWSYCIVEYPLISAMSLFYPVVPHTDHCHSSIHCMSQNVMVWQTCFLMTKHSALFELPHVPILRPSTPTSRNYISFNVYNLFGIYTDWARYNIDLAGVTREVTGNAIFLEA